MILDDSAPRYLPHCTCPELLAMGLSPLDGGRWIEVDSSLARFHAHKQVLAAERKAAVYGWLPVSLPAQDELAEQLLRHLLEAHGDVYRRDAGAVHCAAGGFSVPWPPAAPDLLWSLSLLVAEDLLLLEQGEGGYRLTAASLCSPSHWRLADKLGRPLREIHDPIPGIHETLTPRIDRFFDHLRPDHPVQRFNWSLQADPELYHDGSGEDPVSAATALYYRVERQTLVRLPRTGAVAFTIRVFLHPLETLAAWPGALAALGDAVAAAPAPLARYKGFDTLRAALARYRLS
ncbi:heme-dependent oxidative N-demethylase family protein [Pseudohaliea rubra]|uniref:DUF3445 domain-containing protein n=1 Tax=Pseudohaliea rubra DSM 19751 TaxID=1265313 RepID=A0A095XY78_9GAMM|nr:DUF3445 domain-containing protein [Pseudohaliea rubra]KGE04701.1 hypothetical protein HRUBRA_00726 [Pseudohaliea rubra DSM 19751]